jgi:glutathione S-transferase
MLRHGFRPAETRFFWCYNGAPFCPDHEILQMMKLVGTPTSPFTRKARVVLAEKRMEYEFVIDGPNEAGTRVPAYNPLGKVPVLVLDDDTTIFDSRVIVEYLDNASPVAKLIPEDTRQRIQVRRWEALADGCTDAAVAVVMEKRRKAELQSADWLARQQGKIDRALSAMSEDLGARNWCSGDFFNLSDVAVGCCLGFLDLRLPHISWRKIYPNLARLTDKLGSRPSFKDTAPPTT